MNKHTPGPWILKTTRTSKVFTHAVIDKETHGTIARVEWTGDDSDPNATLIAAAPDLLQALESLVGAFETNVRDCETWVQYQNARTAISKAK